MTPEAWVAWFFASVFICGALFLLLAACLMKLDDLRSKNERGWRPGGGYRGADAIDDKAPPPPPGYRGESRPAPAPTKVDGPLKPPPRGGYIAGEKPVSEYRRPPVGPAPGGRK